MGGRSVSRYSDEAQQQSHAAADDDDEPVVLGVENLLGVWLLLWAGCQMALVVFVAELVAFRHRHRVRAALARVIRPPARLPGLPQRAQVLLSKFSI